MISPEVFMNAKLCFLFAAVAIAPVTLLAQAKSEAPAASPANPITASEKGVYSFVSNAVIGAAEKMPEEKGITYFSPFC
jgi:branched-subunit amino acid permease